MLALLAMWRRSSILLVGVFALGCEHNDAPDPRCWVMPPNDSPVVARVGGTALSMSLIEKRMREQGSAASRYADAPAIRRFVEDQVRFELLVQAALERGIDKDPEVIEAARKVMVRRLLQQDLNTEATTEATEATEAAVRAYYDGHLEEYQQPERRRVGHIALPPTPEGLARAQGLGQKLGAQPAADLGVRFREAAETYSQDKATRGRGGELGNFVSRDELEKELGLNFAAQAFRLGVGELSSTPVQSTRGWHLMFVFAKRDAVARSLDEVRPEIKDRLLQSERAQVFDGYLREIRQRYPVALYEDKLPELISRLSGVSSGRP